MKVESTATVVFSEKEVKAGLVALLDCERNDLLHNDPRHKKLSAIIKLAGERFTTLDYVNGEYYLMIDGVSESEEF